MADSKKIFCVPFNTDFDEYPDTIVEKYKDHIAEVYFPLPSELLPNARGSMQSLNTDSIIKFARYLVSRNITPVALFNSSWTPVEAYANEYIGDVINKVREMYNAGVSKIIVGNYYIVAGRIFENSIPGIQVSASINSRHDTPDKVMAHVGFCRPKHVYLDRSFNRKWNEFMHVTKALRMVNIQTSVLANEGCLYGCPFKTDHDVQIGMASYHGTEFLQYTSSILGKYDNLNETIQGLNDTIGCANVYRRNPWYLLKSPFIRPEDLDKYLPYVDYVKLAGRNRNTAWIENMLQAYINRSYDGSLLDILDVADIQALDAEKYNNKELDGIMEMTSKCHKVCISCGKCSKFYDEHCLKIKSTQVTEDDMSGVTETNI